MGAWFTSHEQRRQWRDNLHIAAYMDLINAWRSFMFKAGNVGAAEEPGDRREALRQMREALASYRTTYNRVWLLGPATVAVASEHLHTYCSYTLSTWLEDESTQQADDSPEIIHARELFNRFLRKGRRGFGTFRTRQQDRRGNASNARSTESMNL